MPETTTGDRTARHCNWMDADISDRQKEYLAAIDTYGFNYSKLAKVLGVAKSTVYSKVAHFRVLGLLPEYEPTRYRYRVASGQIRVGNLDVKIRNSSPEVQKWIADNVPEGATVVDLLLALVVDAIEETRT